MEKQKKIGIAMLVTAALLVIMTGVALAQGFPPVGSGENDVPEDAAYWGPMHGFGWRRTSQTDFPPMMSAMIEAVAEETGMSVDQIVLRIGEGEYLADIALEGGMSEEAYLEFRAEVREVVLTNAVEEGWMTEEQFQWMAERMNENQSYYGSGYPCHSGGEDYVPGYDSSPHSRSRRW